MVPASQRTRALEDTGDAGWVPGLERFPGGGKWQPGQVFSPEKSHGQRGAGGSERKLQKLDMASTHSPRTDRRTDLGELGRVTLKRPLPSQKRKNRIKHTLNWAPDPGFTRKSRLLFSNYPALHSEVKLQHSLEEDLPHTRLKYTIQNLSSWQEKTRWIWW